MTEDNLELYVVESPSTVHKGMSLWGLGATQESALRDAGENALGSTIRLVVDQHEKNEIWKSYPHSRE